MIKIVVLLLLLAIVGSLFSGLFFLYRDRGNSSRTVRALTLRVALSVGVFIILLAAFRFGFIPGYSQ